MKTQCERLSDLLLKGRAIDPLLAWMELGIYRLASRIKDLRDGHLHGVRYNITTEIAEVKNRYGETARVARYYMEDQAIIDAVIGIKESQRGTTGRNSIDRSETSGDATPSHGV